ncbi:MAG: hypothetical protein BGP06_04430 [Rhizobiales bacterium 65-9]|nr:hypothetical protein [Hyphomicrobiales bacterium]OJY32449.1 MAG: hypothetical protein BGP06_04430 [Rhizobiales bacterium 65-9]
MTANIELPAQIVSILGPLLIVLTALALLWIVLSVVQRMHRKAYNLTKAETAGAPVKPDFLTVDHAARADAAARGRVFEEQRAAAAAAKSPVASACRLTQTAAVVAAVLSFVSAAAGALLKVEMMQSAYNNLGSWDRMMAIIANYKAGFAVAAAIILVSLVQLIQSFRPKHA